MMSRLDWHQVFKHGAFATAAGCVCAGASIILCLCTQVAFWAFEHAWVIVWLLPVIGILELAVYGWLGLPLDLSTRHVMSQMRRDDVISPKLAPGILLCTCMTILCGGSVGKEAGALQMGASLGANLARPFKLQSVYVKNKGESMEGYAAACGMAATFAALFFAPLGSAVFVLELSRFKKSISRHIVSILLACFIAYAIARIVGIGDVVTPVQAPPLDWLLVRECLLTGVACAVCGIFFAAAIKWTHDLTRRISKNFKLWVVVGGVLFALLVTVCEWQQFCGSGGNVLNKTLTGAYESWDFAIKALLTLLCLGFWFKGGEIMPSLCIGALLGASSSAVIGGEPIFGAMVGAVAFFAAFSRCPIAAFLLGCEIFGWSAAPALLIAIAVTFALTFLGGGAGERLLRLLHLREHGC